VAESYHGTANTSAQNGMCIFDEHLSGLNLSSAQAATKLDLRSPISVFMPFYGNEYYIFHSYVSCVALCDSNRTFLTDWHHFIIASGYILYRYGYFLTLPVRALRNLNNFTHNA